MGLVALVGGRAEDEEDGKGGGEEVRDVWPVPEGGGSVVLEENTEVGPPEMVELLGMEVADVLGGVAVMFPPMLVVSDVPAVPLLADELVVEIPKELEV